MGSEGAAFCLTDIRLRGRTAALLGAPEHILLSPMQIHSLRHLWFRREQVEEVEFNLIWKGEKMMVLSYEQERRVKVKKKARG